MDAAARTYQLPIANESSGIQLRCLQRQTASKFKQTTLPHYAPCTPTIYQTKCVGACCNTPNNSLQTIDARPWIRSMVHKKPIFQLSCLSTVSQNQLAVFRWSKHCLTLSWGCKKYRRFRSKLAVCVQALFKQTWSKCDLGRHINIERCLLWYWKKCVETSRCVIMCTGVWTC
jgi:hypothetical protein